MENAVEETLARVGPGTPSGEVFRRYWLPVGVAAHLGGRRGEFLGTNNPLRLKVLGENLVLFRDGSGKPHLLEEHCSHRGTSLYYGRVEQDCLRCLYHGWAYDGAGNVLETPGEPPDSNFKNSVKHPAYPCVEVAGLIFAYMGPPEQMPLFPRYPMLFRTDGVRITGNGGRIQKSNVFLQTLDNVLDVWHRGIGHTWFKGKKFTDDFHWGKDGRPPTPIRYDRTPWGARYVTLQDTARDGMFEYHETHAVFPCQRAGQSGGSSMNWAVPMDDYTTRWFGVHFQPFDEDGKIPEHALESINDFTLTDSRADVPDDWVEQVGHWWNLGHPWRSGPIWEDEVFMGTQGPAENGFLPNWEKWHMGSSDRGVALMHRIWKEQVDRVKEGLDPVGIIRDSEEDRPIPLTGDRRHLGWDEGIEMFNMSVEERMQVVERRLASATWADVPVLAKA
jgi:phenylpropionate dioxygenase-like ring-hydroxylating dioxygenase large terminal subunit